VLVYVLLQTGGGHSVSSAVADNVPELAFMNAIDYCITGKVQAGCQVIYRVGVCRWW
jgi:hypothetical protein